MEQARNNGLGLRPGMAKTITGPSAMRVVRGPAGGMLVVYETGPENARTLIFEWAGSKTELTSFPADWRKLKDDELSKLHRTAAGG